MVVMVMLWRHLLKILWRVWRQLKIGKDPSPRRLNAKVFPVDPSQPRGQVRSIPFLASLGSNLAPEASVDVGKGFHLVRVTEDFPQKRDVSDGKPEGVDLGESFLVRECWNVDSKLLKSRIDA